MKNEFKGTKGKVRISGATEGTLQQCPNTVVYLDDFVFAKVYGKTKKECEANAKLIACASEVLEELIHANKLLKCIVSLAIKPATERIEKLIKKATEL